MGQITDNKSVIDSTPAAAGIPETTPEVTTGATPESTPAPIKEKKPRAPKAPKAPGEKRVSALGTIRDLIKEGKTKEEILAIVTPMFPDRTPASLSGQVTSTISAQKKVQ